MISLYIAMKLRSRFGRKLYVLNTFGTNPSFSTHFFQMTWKSSSSPAGSGMPRTEM
jgi:hypothetical protein